MLCLYMRLDVAYFRSRRYAVGAKTAEWQVGAMRAVAARQAARQRPSPSTYFQSNSRTRRDECVAVSNGFAHNDAASAALGNVTTGSWTGARLLRRQRDEPQRRVHQRVRQTSSLHPGRSRWSRQRRGRLLASAGGTIGVSSDAPLFVNAAWTSLTYRFARPFLCRSFGRFSGSNCRDQELKFVELHFQFCMNNLR